MWWHTCVTNVVKYANHATNLHIPIVLHFILDTSICFLNSYFKNWSIWNTYNEDFGADHNLNINFLHLWRFYNSFYVHLKTIKRDLDDHLGNPAVILITDYDTNKTTTFSVDDQETHHRLTQTDGWSIHPVKSCQRRNLSSQSNWHCCTGCWLLEHATYVGHMCVVDSA